MLQGGWEVPCTPPGCTAAVVENKRACEEEVEDLPGAEDVGVMPPGACRAPEETKGFISERVLRGEQDSPAGPARLILQLQAPYCLLSLGPGCRAGATEVHLCELAAA